MAGVVEQLLQCGLRRKIQWHALLDHDVCNAIAREHVFDIVLVMSELINSLLPYGSNVKRSFSKDHEPPRWIESPYEESEIARQVRVDSV